MFYKSPDHQHRLITIIEQINKHDNGRIDPEYGAALYILTADPGTWKKAQEYVSASGINFSQMLEEMDFSGGYLVLIQWAANLFNSFAAHIDPVELMRLDDTNFELAISALRVRRGGLTLKSIADA